LGHLVYRIHDSHLVGDARTSVSRHYNKIVYRKPVTGPRSPGIVHRQSAINKLAPKPAPKPTPRPNANPTRTLTLNYKLIVPTEEENRSPDY